MSYLFLTLFTVNDNGVAVETVPKFDKLFRRRLISEREGRKAPDIRLGFYSRNIDLKQ